MKDLDMFLLEEESKMGGTSKNKKQPKQTTRSQKILWVVLSYSYLSCYILAELGYI